MSDQHKDAAKNVKGGLDGVRAWSATLSNLFCPALAGGIIDRVLYYLVLVFCLLTFFSSIGSVFESARKPVYAVSSAVDPTYNFPAFFLCPSPELYTPPPDNDLDKDGIELGYNAAQSMPFNGGGNPTLVDNPPVADPAALITKLNEFFGITTLHQRKMPPSPPLANGLAPACHVYNYKGNFKSLYAAQKKMMVIVEENKVPRGVSLIGTGGFFPANGSPFDADGRMSVPMFVFGLGNTINVMQLRRVVKKNTTGWLFRETTTTLEHKLTMTSVRNDLKPLLQNQNQTQLQAGIPLVVEQNLFSVYLLQAATFVTETISVRNKTFGEIWAELGGVWAASLMVLTLFFKTRSVTVIEGAPTDTNKEVMVGLWRGKSTVNAWVGDQKAQIEAAEVQTAAEAAKDEEKGVEMPEREPLTQA